MHDDCREAVTVGAVIVRNGRVLLLQRTPEDTFPNIWELPGGRRDCGEEPEDTLAREVKEETGLTVIRATFAGTFTYDLTKSGRLTHVVQLNYRVIASDGSARHSHEHQASAWVEPNNLGAHPASEETRRTIASALSI